MAARQHGKQSKGKKGRKFGREKDRHPAHKRYNAEKRWIFNKAMNVVRKMRKHKNYKMPSNLSDELRRAVEALL